MPQIHQLLVRAAHKEPKLRASLLRILRAGNAFAGGVFDVYPATYSHKRQPPGVIMDPRAAQIVGLHSLGKVRIPPASGVRPTLVSDLAGVPVDVLDPNKVRQLEVAYLEDTPLPPITIEVSGKSATIQLLDGHHRLAAARRSGQRAIPVQWLLR